MTGWYICTKECVLFLLISAGHQVILSVVEWSEHADNVEVAYAPDAIHRSSVHYMQ